MDFTEEAGTRRANLLLLKGSVFEDLNTDVELFDELKVAPFEGQLLERLFQVLVLTYLGSQRMGTDQRPEHGDRPTRLEELVNFDYLVLADEVFTFDTPVSVRAFQLGPELALAYPLPVRTDSGFLRSVHDFSSVSSVSIARSLAPISAFTVGASP